ncbi:DUF1015 domain-containing protein [soil metagenome]
MTSPAAGPARLELQLRAMRPLIYRTTPQRSAAAVTVGPLDVWDDEHVARLVQQRTDHVLHLVAPTAEVQQSEAAGSTARAWLDDAVLAQASAPALFAWTWEVAGRQVQGVAGAVPLPLADKTVPHERVRAATVDLRERQLDHARVQAEPILLLHDGDPLLSAALVERIGSGQPLVDVDAAGERHRVWPITDAGEQRAIRSRLSTGAAPVVADGHHRVAALDRLAQRGWVDGMVLIVDTATSDLSLTSVHRVVPGLRRATVVTAGAQLVELPEGTEAAWLASPGPDHLRWVLADESTLVGLDMSLQAARATNPAATRCSTPVALDACHLHSHLFDAWRVDERRVDYVHDWQEARRRAGARNGLAVRIAAPQLSRIIDVARDGHLLPPKATSIGPKPRVGMLMLPAPQGGIGGSIG